MCVCVLFGGATYHKRGCHITEATTEAHDNMKGTIVKQRRASKLKKQHRLLNLTLYLIAISNDKRVLYYVYYVIFFSRSCYLETYNFVEKI